MKTMILYRSRHRGNTLKLVEAIRAAHPDDVDVLDVGGLGNRPEDAKVDLSGYRVIVLASGIYYSNFDAKLRRVASESLRDGDKVLTICTYGGKNGWYGKDVDGICRMKQAGVLGSYGCRGYDAWGPFKLVGGLNKGRPDAADVRGAVEFYDRFVREYGDIVEQAYRDREARDAWDEAHPRKGLVGTLTGKLKTWAQK